MSQFITDFDNLLWSPIPALESIPILGWLSPLAVLLVGTGLWYSIKTGFIQVRGFKKGMRLVFGGLFKKSDKADKSGMSSFQALCTAIAAQVGTGNIVGASTAIAVGGPGAIFWMWIAAFFGMATIFVEATLAQKTKTTWSNGLVVGGPTYYIREAFKNKFGQFLAILFAFLIILSLGFMGCAVQSNGIAGAWQTVAQNANLNEGTVKVIVIVIGAILAIAALLIFTGGVASIASFTERVVPFMAVIYIIGSLIVIFANFKGIPNMFASIFKGAFNGTALVGGSAGWVISQALSKGVARGLFSNEAGMGSTPHAHAIAKVPHPAEQGYAAMIGVFIDTFIILNLTAFVVIGSGVCFDHVDPVTGETIAAGTLTGATLAQAGFRTVFGSFGNIFIAIALTFFAFSTVIGWYYFAEQNVNYIFGTREKGINPMIIKVFGVLVAICVFIGAYVVVLSGGAASTVNDVWNLQDALNGLMVIPNLIGILALTGVAVTALKENIEKYGLK